MSKRCTNCGGTFPDEFAFCPDDAGDLVAVAPAVAPPSPARPPRNDGRDAQARGRGVAIGLAVGVVATVGTVVALSRRGRGATANDAAVPVPAAPQPVAPPEGPGGAATQPSAAPAAAPARRCFLEGAPTTVAEEISIGDGIWLEADGPRVALGYVAPPRHRNGADDAALIQLGWNGIVTRVIDPADRSGERGNAFSPVTIQKVRPTLAQGGVAALIDAVERRGPGERTIRCAYAQQTIASPDSTVEQDEASLFVADGTPYFCRSFPLRSSAAGVVFGMYPVGPSVKVFYWNSTGPSADLWTLPRSTTGSGPVATFRDLRRRDVMEGAAFERAGDLGYVLAFRYHDALYVGAVRPTFEAVGPLQTVPLSGAPGRPQIAWNGRELAMVVAVRPRGTDGPARNQLHGGTFTFGSAPPGLVRLPLGEVSDGDEFAPSLRALGDGSWLLAWTFGELSENVSRGGQWVHAMRLTRGLYAGSDRLELPYNSLASDPELAVDGDRFAIVSLVGARRTRSAVFVEGRCP